MPHSYRRPEPTNSSFKHMERFKKTQIAELLLVAALLVIITPLLSTASLRSANLYFVINVIIIAVAAEAGLLSSFLVSAGNEKPAAVCCDVVSQSQDPTILSPCLGEKIDGTSRPHQSAMATQVVENYCSSDKIFGAVHKDPDIFFIGESDSNEAEHVEDDVVDEVGEGISGQELFQKAEIFIGNFYKQLNIQREESWKKLHDFTRKAL